MSAWFDALGEPVAAEELRMARAYLAGLGIAEALPIEGVRDWNDARSVVTNPAWDRRWWEAEQLEKQRLHARAGVAHGEQETLQLLACTLEASEAVKGAAARAAARFGCADAGLVGSAAGAASEALHLAELARLAGESDAHPFRLKQALFAAGRWPLGILNGQYRIF
jgi:hypothetical protein